MSVRERRLRPWAALPPALAGGVLALAWMEATHSLATHGRWTPTKVTAARSLLGAEAYRDGSQALAGGMLGLGAWHGFQEVVLEDALDVRGVDVDVVLGEGAYLVSLLYDADGRAFAGLRVSRDPKVPNRLLRGERASGFEPSPPLAPRHVQGPRHAVRWEVAGGTATVSVDGAVVGELALPGPGPYRPGFRGGFAKSYVDAVRVRAPEGSFRDGFELPPYWPGGVAVAAAMGWLAGVAVQAGLARRRRTDLVAAYVAMFGGTAAILAAMLWGFAFHRGRQPRYPPLDPALAAEERATVRQHVKVRRREVMEAHAGRQLPEGAARVLLLGTSQTWGSGALRESETLCAQLQATLNRTAGGRLFQCVNGGISGATSAELAAVWEAAWARLAADVVIVNLGNNDKDHAVFAASLERIVEVARSHGSRVVLVQEANTRERFDRNLTESHRVMAAVGERLGVPVVDMHAHLERLRDSGFLWWDKVHLTSFGQRLAAERLAAAVLAPPDPAAAQ